MHQARGSSGAGLGLPIARWIVEEHAGEIEIADAEGGGTQVCVRLPTLRADARGGETHVPDLSIV
jgi:two-component system, OmpR family, sensor kinase